MSTCTFRCSRWDTNTAATPQKAKPSKNHLLIKKTIIFYAPNQQDSAKPPTAWVLKFNCVNVCATAPPHSTATATASIRQQGNLSAKVQESPKLLIPDSHWCTTLLPRPPCFPSTGLYNITDLSPTMLLWHWSRMWTTVILNLYCVSKAANICLGTPRLFKREFPPPLKKEQGQPWKQTILWRFKKPIYKINISIVALLCSLTALSEQISELIHAVKM